MTGMQRKAEYGFYSFSFTYYFGKACCRLV